MTSASLQRTASAPDKPAGAQQRPWWPWLRNGLTAAFFSALAVLLYRQARAMDWDAVRDTVTALPASVLLLAAAIAFASHLLYACFDLLGRRLTGHKLAAPSVMAVTFVSYAFNLNMGSLIGSVASRYRLYGRLGLANHTITRVMLFSMLTNWMGYLLLAGLAFLLFPLPLPAQWGVDQIWLQAGGAVLVAAAVGYLLLCGLASRRASRSKWTVHGHSFTLPGLRMALLQLLMSCANWALMGGVLYVLMQQQLSYVTLLTVLLVAAVAGVITHVPAGLGVLEAVFVALLGGQIAPPILIGMLLAYRALYYLAPLAIAVLMFLVLEARHKAARSSP